MKEIFEFFSINADWSIEWVGIFATLITIFSFSLKYQLTFRQVNLFACIIWILYAFLIDSFAMLITNFIIFLTHIYYLYLHHSGKHILSNKNNQIRANKTK